MLSLIISMVFFIYLKPWSSSEMMSNSQYLFNKRFCFIILSFSENLRKSVKPSNGFLLGFYALEKSYKFKKIAFKYFSYGLSSISGLAFESISSVHDSRRKDRIWAVHCGAFFPYLRKVGLSVWTFYVNDFNGSMTFECQDGNVVTGIDSYHSNHHADRRYKFRCTFLPNVKRSRCGWTKYTDLGSRWAKITPPFQTLTGVRSYRDNSTQ